MGKRSNDLLCRLLLCCAPVLCACSPDSELRPSSEALDAPSLYRFVDEQPHDPRSRDNSARAGVEHLKVLRPGFWRVQSPTPGEDGTVALGDLIQLGALHPDATGIGIVAREGKSLRYTYIEVPDSGTSEDLAQKPVRIISESDAQETSGAASVYARELFPDVYESQPLIVPPSARIDFGIAVDHAMSIPKKDPVLFEIVMARGEHEDLLFSERLVSPPGGPRVRPPWREHTIDLSQYAGQKAHFVFRATVELSDAPTNRERIRTVPLWGNPILLSGKSVRETATPNLIIISLDTLRADHLGVYGYERNTSPNIDRFAENAIVYEQCISPSSWTTPAHASLLSGLNPAVHGAGGHDKLKLRNRVVTLAELAHQKGYLTVALTDGGAVAGNTGMAQGFGRYFDNEPRSSEVQRTSELQMYRALKWLNTYKEHPFFMFFHTYETHAPYDPPNPFRDRFKTGKMNYSTGISEIREDALESIGLYDGSIAFTDYIMGQFFSWLEKEGLLENTAIMLLSDHGDEFWDHGSIRHLSTLYEELVHVPFIVRLPGKSPRGGRVERLISLTDGFATALDLMDIPYQATLDSQSVLPLFQEGPNATTYTRQSVEGFVYSDRLDRLTIAHRTATSKYIARADLTAPDSPISAQMSSGARSGNLMLGRTLLEVLSDPEGGPGITEEFYDLSGDPRELSNLAASDISSTAKGREEFKTLLERYLAVATEFDFDGESRLGPTAEEIAELEGLGYLK